MAKPNGTNGTNLPSSYSEAVRNSPVMQSPFNNTNEDETALIRSTELYLLRQMRDQATTEADRRDIGSMIAWAEASGLASRQEGIREIVDPGRAEMARARAEFDRTHVDLDLARANFQKAIAEGSASEMDAKLFSAARGFAMSADDFSRNAQTSGMQDSQPVDAAATRDQQMAVANLMNLSREAATDKERVEIDRRLARVNGAIGPNADERTQAGIEAVRAECRKIIAEDSSREADPAVQTYGEDRDPLGRVETNPYAAQTRGATPADLQERDRQAVLDAKRTEVERAIQRLQGTMYQDQQERIVLSGMIESDQKMRQTSGHQRQDRLIVNHWLYGGLSRLPEPAVALYEMLPCAIIIEHQYAPFLVVSMPNLRKLLVRRVIRPKSSVPSQSLLEDRCTLLALWRSYQLLQGLTPWTHEGGTYVMEDPDWVLRGPPREELLYKYTTYDALRPNIPLGIDKEFEDGNVLMSNPYAISDWTTAMEVRANRVGRSWNSCRDPKSKSDQGAKQNVSEGKKGQSIVAYHESLAKSLRHELDLEKVGSSTSMAMAAMPETPAQQSPILQPRAALTSDELDDNSSVFVAWFSASLYQRGKVFRDKYDNRAETIALKAAIASHVGPEPDGYTDAKMRILEELASYVKEIVGDTFNIVGWIERRLGYRKVVMSLK